MDNSIGMGLSMRTCMAVHKRRFICPCARLFTKEDQQSTSIPGNPVPTLHTIHMHPAIYLGKLRIKGLLGSMSLNPHC